jgi:Tol biopolymer transport system component
VLDACWSADGRWIAFTQNARDSSDGIYAVDMDGVAEPRRIAMKPASASFIAPYSWSPDGVLLTTAVVDNKVSIWAARATPDQVQPADFRKVLESDGNAGAGTFSPDGRYVTYQSTESGRPEIYVTAWSGENPAGQPILVSRGGGGIPRWSHDGKQVYYSFQGKLMFSDIGRTPNLTASAPIMAWNLATLRVPPNGQGDGLYDLLPDGRLVAVQGSEEDGDVTQVQTALHFDQVVKQKMRAAQK